jgi:uncharacterized protein (DUF1778 family)
MVVAAKKAPRRRNKSDHVNIRLTPEQKAELTVAATHAGLGVSPWMLALALREARKAPD